MSLPAASEETLPDLKLRIGDRVKVRYFVGSVPGWGASPGEYFLMIYSPTGARAWILMAYPNGRRMFPVDDAFQLRRRGGRWSVLQGFGGLDTYRKLGRFANWMAAHRPAIRVRLKSCAACCAPDPPR